MCRWIRDTCNTKLIEYTSGVEKYNLLLSAFNNADTIVMSEMNQKGTNIKINNAYPWKI